MTSVQRQAPGFTSMRNRRRARNIASTFSANAAGDIWTMILAPGPGFHALVPLRWPPEKPRPAAFAIAKAAGRGFSGGHRSGTNAWKPGPGAKIIVQMSPAAFAENVEAIFLARRRFRIEVNP